MPLLARENLVPGLILSLVAVVATLAVVASFGRRGVETYEPSELVAAEVGEGRIGPIQVTLDASDVDVWRFFDFSTGTVVDRPTADGWDIAFRRFQIGINGGEGFRGVAGVIDLGEVSFDSVSSVPRDGYVGAGARRDTANAEIGRWYSYSWTSHLLRPSPRVFAIRTADGRFAKLEMVGYYCPGIRAGCPTFRYVYQGDGGTEVPNDRESTR